MGLVLLVLFGCSVFCMVIVTLMNCLPMLTCVSVDDGGCCVVDAGNVVAGDAWDQGSRRGGYEIVTNTHIGMPIVMCC